MCLSLVLDIETGKPGLTPQVSVCPLNGSLLYPFLYHGRSIYESFAGTPSQLTCLPRELHIILSSSHLTVCPVDTSYAFSLWVCLPGAPSPSLTGPSAGLLLSSWLGMTARFPAVLPCLVLFFLTLGSFLSVCVSHILSSSICRSPSV